MIERRLGNYPAIKAKHDKDHKHRICGCTDTKTCETMEWLKRAKLIRDAEKLMAYAVMDEDGIWAWDDRDPMAIQWEEDPDSYRNMLDLVFFRILHEVDLYNEGQDTNVLTASQARSAQRWLERAQPLTDEFKNTTI